MRAVLRRRLRFDELFRAVERPSGETFCGAVREGRERPNERGRQAFNASAKQGSGDDGSESREEKFQRPAATLRLELGAERVDAFVDGELDPLGDLVGDASAESARKFVGRRFRFRLWRRRRFVATVAGACGAF